MKHELQIGLEKLLETGDFNFTIRSYSGRGMYGSSCLAIVCDTNELALIMFTLGLTQQSPNLLDYIQGMRRDNMGLSSVFYWPRCDYTIPDDENE